jgi:hypothetical protein
MKIMHVVNTLPRALTAGFKKVEVRKYPDHPARVGQSNILLNPTDYRVANEINSAVLATSGIVFATSVVTMFLALIMDLPERASLSRTPDVAPNDPLYKTGKSPGERFARNFNTLYKVLGSLALTSVLGILITGHSKLQETGGEIGEVLVRSVDAIKNKRPRGSG